MEHPTPTPTPLPFFQYVQSQLTHRTSLPFFEETYSSHDDGEMGHHSHEI